MINLRITGVYKTKFRFSSFGNYILNPNLYEQFVSKTKSIRKLIALKTKLLTLSMSIGTETRYLQQPPIPPKRTGLNTISPWKLTIPSTTTNSSRNGNILASNCRLHFQLLLLIHIRATCLRHYLLLRLPIILCQAKDPIPRPTIRTIQLRGDRLQ